MLQSGWDNLFFSPKASDCLFETEFNIKYGLKLKNRQAEKNKENKKIDSNEKSRTTLKQTEG